jgi:hypothetical protein
MWDLPFLFEGHFFGEIRAFLGIDVKVSLWHLLNDDRISEIFSNYLLSPLNLY